MSFRAEGHFQSLGSWSMHALCCRWKGNVADTAGHGLNSYLTPGLSLFQVLGELDAEDSQLNPFTGIALIQRGWNHPRWHFLLGGSWLLIIRYKDLVLLPLVGKMLKDYFSFRTSYGIHIILHFDVSHWKALLQLLPINLLLENLHLRICFQGTQLKTSHDSLRLLSYALKQYSWNIYYFWHWDRLWGISGDYGRTSPLLHGAYCLGGE